SPRDVERGDGGDEKRREHGWGSGLAALMPRPSGEDPGACSAGRCKVHGGAALALRFSRPPTTWSPDAVLVELVVQGAGLDAEQARGLGLDAAGLLVGLADELALEVLEDLGQRHLLGHVE